MKVYTILYKWLCLCVKTFADLEIPACHVHKHIESLDTFTGSKVGINRKLTKHVNIGILRKILVYTVLGKSKILSYHIQGYK